MHIQVIYQKRGYQINDILVNNIKYADNNLLLTDKVKGTQQPFNDINEASNKYGLETNIKKTKYMITTKKPQGQTKIRIKNEKIQRASSCIDTQKLSL